AGQTGEAGLYEQRRRRRCAAVPGRREQRIELRPEVREQALAAVLDVFTLRRERTRRAELRARDAVLVILVRVSLLMEAEQAGHARAMRELRGQLRGDRCGNHRDVERQPRIFEQRQKTRQAVVGPAAFVVTEEEREG